jgi:hypothetical protein
LIAEKLKAKYNLPWIVDLRDPWTTVFYNSLFPRTKRTITKDKKIEDRIVKNADALSVVSGGLVEEFKDRNSNVNLIYNGYDETDFEDQTVKKDKDSFVITYVGNFMASQNVESFWYVLSQLINSNTDFRERLKIKIVGNADELILNSIAEFDLERFSENIGFVDHKKAIQFMLESDLLLFVIPDSDQNQKIITGKLFEYLASGNDILSYGPTNGDAASILEDMGKSKMLNYSDKEGGKMQILDCFNKEEKQKSALVGVKSYSRKSLTKQLSELLDSIV